MKQQKMYTKNSKNPKIQKSKKFQTNIKKYKKLLIPKKKKFN